MNDVFTLKKNSWHTKLMKFIWNYSYHDFPNMCPYFWLSIFNVLLVIFGYIPYLLYRLLKPVFKAISNTTSDVSFAFDEYCKQRKKNWLDNFVDKLLNEDESSFEDLEQNDKKWRNLKYDSQILYLARYTTYTEYELKGAYSEETIQKALALRENFKKWDVLQEKKRLERQNFLNKLKQEEIIKKSEAIERRKKISQITVKLKSFFKVLGGALILGFVYLMIKIFYKLGIWITTLKWTVIGTYALKILVLLTLLALAIGIIFLLVKSLIFLSCKFGKYCIPCEYRRNKINNFFKMNSLFNFFVFIGKGIKEVFLIIKMLYKNNCPSITWHD